MSLLTAIAMKRFDLIPFAVVAFALTVAAFTVAKKLSKVNN